MNRPLLSLRSLTVQFQISGKPTKAVDALDLDVGEGEVVALVGESGSGKTQATLAALGLSPATAAVSGSARFDGEELIGASTKKLDAVRGKDITMIFQEPMVALDPLATIGTQIAAPLRAHAGLSRREAIDRAGALLEETRVRDARRRLRDYPHQLSGGERQRAMIAMAIANAPRLLIADEPTTALDATVQAQILELLMDLRRKRGLSLLLVTHDLNLVRRVADRVAVMRNGALQEVGPVDDVFRARKSEYTRMLLDAEPSGRKLPPPADSAVLLDARGVSVHFRRGGLFTRSTEVRAVDGVDLAIRRGETVALVGESGSGKSTLARAVLRLAPARGQVNFDGVDLATLAPRALRALRRRMQLVFQDPFGALSPRLTVGAIVAEGLATHEPNLSRDERDTRAAEALAAVGLDPSQRYRTPDAFSGGQRQRIAIARAVVMKPNLIALDEPTSALDRSVQRDILDLLRRVQSTLGLAYLFITHDLAVARAMADRVVVMRAGKIVESGTVEDVFDRPQTDYARALVSAALWTRR